MRERIIGGTGTRPTWDECWMDMARIVGQRSLCDRDKVGAVVVSLGNHEGFYGSYNGPPAGYNVAGENCREWCPRARPGNENLDPGYRDCPANHAEANAITRADYTKIQGGTIYVTSSVCLTCAKLVANSGLKRVVMRVDGSQTYRDPQATIDFLHTSGITTEIWACGYDVPRVRFSHRLRDDESSLVEIGTYGSQLGW